MTYQDERIWEYIADEVEAMPIQKVCAELCDRTGDDYISVKSEDDVRITLAEKLFYGVIDYQPEYDSMRGL